MPDDPSPGREPPSDLDAVFAGLRRQATRGRGDDDIAARHMRLADVCERAGRTDVMAQALEMAAESERFRFPAAVRLARLRRAEGETSSAVDWFERAAAAVAPTPDEEWDVLDELAATLEELGMETRALAVLIELQAVAGPYRDLEARIIRVSRSLVGG